MSKDNLSFFDEKRGVVSFNTDWGRWWQTVHDVHIQVKLPEGTRAKQVTVNVKPKHIQCTIQGTTIFEGALPRIVHSEDTIWTVEDGHVCILLSKADYSIKDDMWECLLADGRFQPDPWTLHEMRKTLDLERFQIENPGMDFSGAKLSKNYDKIAGSSIDRSEELKRKHAENNLDTSSSAANTEPTMDAKDEQGRISA